MKKILCFVLLFILTATCVLLTACGDKQPPSDETSAVSEEITTDVETSDEATTKEDTTEAEVTTVEETTEEETTEEETTVIVDVMVGETLDADYAANFTVSKAFSSNMVVQRGEFLRVWGWANTSENGKKISAEFMGMFAEGLVKDGEWEIQFGARLSACADLGNTMKIYTDKKTVEFTDVLVGDVYMVIGQSNTAYSVENHLQYCNNADQGGTEVLDYKAPIRLNYNTAAITNGYPQRGTEETVRDVLDNNGWTYADYVHVSPFTAIGYYTAFHLVNMTDGKIPVGLIEIDGNGLPLGAFMCNQVAAEKGTDKFNSKKGYNVTTGVNADAGRYMYNHYMFPFEKYSLAGIIWYQGESDFQPANSKVFAENFSALMTYMRGTHNVLNPNFPVYIVEFPSIYKGNGNAFMDFGVMRGVLGTVTNILPNSYLAVSCDLWDQVDYWNNLHPNCKYEQAERVAAIAGYVNCGIGTLEQATGPILSSVEFSDDNRTAILTYTNVGEGLMTSDGGTEVKGFEVIKKGMAINSKAKLTATITAKDQITVTSSLSISGIGYNVLSENYYGKEINLCNSFGCPAGAVVYLND